LKTGTFSSVVAFAGIFHGSVVNPSLAFWTVFVVKKRFRYLVISFGIVYYRSVEIAVRHVHGIGEIIFVVSRQIGPVGLYDGLDVVDSPMWPLRSVIVFEASGRLGIGVVIEMQTVYVLIEIVFEVFVHFGVRIPKAVELIAQERH
jgi:hypothetical protein